MTKDQFNIVDLIKKKKDGGALSCGEIDRWISGIRLGDTAERVPDYQLTALLMAICFQGMNDEETRDLTMCMAKSGDIMDLRPVGGTCVDKHSTGGVGDTTTLVLAPLVAACGGKVAKMSGRGLGHTGGTVDKLESIAGFQTELTKEAFIRQVRAVGCAVVGQSEDLAPADKVLYSLRDVTATVDSMPLIVSSIMSKKIAAGCTAVVLDVKTGSGAIMPGLEQSVELARAMVRVGDMAGLSISALVTGMDQPLGTHIGNALEVKEAIDILSGRAGGRLLEVSLRLGAMMLVAGGYARDEAAARERLIKALESGKGLDKLEEMIEAQGGDARVVRNVDLLPKAAHEIPVLAPKGGYITKMDTMTLGEVSRGLGAGRMKKGDDIDPAVGIVMQVELSDAVSAGDPLAMLHVKRMEDVQPAISAIHRAITVGSVRKAPPRLVYAAVRTDNVEWYP